MATKTAHSNLFKFDLFSWFSCCIGKRTKPKVSKKSKHRRPQESTEFIEEVVDTSPSKTEGGCISEEDSSQEMMDCSSKQSWGSTNKGTTADLATEEDWSKSDQCPKDPPEDDWRNTDQCHEDLNMGRFLSAFQKPLGETERPFFTWQAKSPAVIDSELSPGEIKIISDPRVIGPKRFQFHLPLSDNCSSGDETLSTSSSTEFLPFPHDPETPCHPAFQQDLTDEQWAYLDPPEERMFVELWDFGEDKSQNKMKWEIYNDFGDVVYEGVMLPAGS